MAGIEFDDHELQEKLKGHPALKLSEVPDGCMFAEQRFPEMFGSTRVVSVVFSCGIDVKVEDTFCPDDLSVHRFRDVYSNAQKECSANITFTGYHANLKPADGVLVEFSDRLNWNRHDGENYRSFFPGNVRTVACHVSFNSEFAEKQSLSGCVSEGALLKMLKGSLMGVIDTGWKPECMRRLADAVLDYDGRTPWEWMHLESLAIGTAAEILKHSSGIEQNDISWLSPEDADRIVFVRDLISGDFAGISSLGELAKKAGLNEFKLKKGFRQLFGTTVFGYAFEVRMTEALKLLKRSRLSIAEVGERVGYSNHAAFAAAFKKRYGYPPRAYRNL